MLGIFKSGISLVAASDVEEGIPFNAVVQRDSLVVIDRNGVVVTTSLR